MRFVACLMLAVALDQVSYWAAFALGAPIGGVWVGVWFVIGLAWGVGTIFLTTSWWTS